MNIAGHVAGLAVGIITLIFGIVVMIFPKILNYLIGIYLIMVAVFGNWRQSILHNGNIGKEL